MKLYSENKNYKLYQGNMLDMLDVIEKESIDSIVTDPPYGLTSITKRFGKEGSAPASTKNNDGSFARLSKGFMGKEWDGSGIEYNIDTWKKCYDVLKPGGYLLAFGGSRTFHRIACAIEDAGFEIRDTIMWLYGSGFPKSMDIEKALNKRDGVEFKSKPASGVGFMNTNDDGYHNTIHRLEQIGDSSQRAKQWQGWGTALKPSFEPIIVARKPFKGSLVDNVIENVVGGINIDECRVETTDTYSYPNGGGGSSFGIGKGVDGTRIIPTESNPLGRFPANTILTYDETDYQEVCGGMPQCHKAGNKNIANRRDYMTSTYKIPKENMRENPDFYGDSGSASRYFYCAKASKKDRDEGLDTFEQEKVNDGRETPIDNAFQRGETLRKNTHPTVKPCDLMQYLVRLVTPDGGTILDPFNGSGSTGKAVMYENKERNKDYKYIGIELTEEYLPIAKARIEYVCGNSTIKQEKLDLYDLD